MAGDSTSKERPILFSAPMVRALLDGRKTQTRRRIKPQPPAAAVDAGVISSGAESNGLWWWLDSKELEWASPVGDEFRCPHGVPGDRLWVREAWQSDVAHAFTKPSQIPQGERYFYAAGGSKDTSHISVCAEGWRPSIHMPRWASRITLEITDVRVERLQDISEADAIAEGIGEYPCTGPYRGPDATYWTADGPHPDAPIKRTTPVAAYKALWEEINGEDGPGSWDANPWVWAVAFKREARA